MAQPIVTIGLGRFRRIAERALAGHPHVSPEELAAAASSLGPLLQRQARVANNPVRALAPRIAVIQLMALLSVVAVFAILGAFLARGGLLMRARGIAVVTGAGRRVSRLRALGRALVAQLPLITLLVVLFQSGVVAGMQAGYGLADGWQGHSNAVVAVAALGMLFLGGGLWAALHPERGLQDRIAGTWLVPR